MRIYLYLLCVLLVVGCPGTDAPGGKKETPDTPKVSPGKAEEAREGCDCQAA